MNDSPCQLELRGAKTNNLKNVDLKLPLKQFTVVTGLSGSGKSSLAFDTLYAEGQRRYTESLSTYTRQFLDKIPRPELESLSNIPPAVALEQKNHIQNNRSTVATFCDIYDYLRMLFTKIGHLHCPACGTVVHKSSAEQVFYWLTRQSPHKRFYILAPLSMEDGSLKGWKDFQKSLLSQGYSRLLITQKNRKKSSRKDYLVADLETLTSEKDFPSSIEKIYLVLDRLSHASVISEPSRTSDALESAFRASGPLLELAVGTIESQNDQIQIQLFSEKLMCANCETTYHPPDPQLFSFNSSLGACTKCSGFGFTLDFDEQIIVPNSKLSLQEGAIDPFTKPAYKEWEKDLLQFCKRHKIPTTIAYSKLSQEDIKLIWNGDPKDKKFPGIFGCFEELKGWKYKLHVRVFIRRYQKQNTCMECEGTRLNHYARAFRLHPEASDAPQLNIVEFCALPLEKALSYFENHPYSEFEAGLTKELFEQILSRLQFLKKVGVGYLTLNRLSKTLSGGECQRISLATQLGHKLCSTLYVLDEPSIGLHPSDTQKLIELLLQLRDHGNTLVVVEHDLDVIRSADYLVEIGPYAGARGGEIIAQGPLESVLQSKGCVTAKYLTGAFSIPPRLTRRSVSLSSPKYPKIKITGACSNNLKNLTVEIPLERFVAITGVSGSGKSTLIHKTLYQALAKILKKENGAVGKFDQLYGIEWVHDIAVLDQKPIGKSARSNPATYLKFYDDIRKIMSNQSLALKRGYTPQYFSFNVDGGRCPVCKGEGEITLEMHFMSDLKLPCEECDGKKFKKSTLEVEFKGKNIFQILESTIDEGLELFREYPGVLAKLRILRDVGLGYLKMGQSSTTLSGGESQRLKIASVLKEKKKSHTIYIFDEPTTGLHLEDIRKLLLVLQDLVDEKNTVIVIEHNLDLIQQADWVLDLGPHGGEEGGELIAQGTPEIIMQNPASLTGIHLKRHLEIKEKQPAFSA